jgi:hypothetical protein
MSYCFPSPDEILARNAGSCEPLESDMESEICRPAIPILADALLAYLDQANPHVSPRYSTLVLDTGSCLMACPLVLLVWTSGQVPYGCSLVLNTVGSLLLALVLLANA